MGPLIGKPGKPAILPSSSPQRCGLPIFFTTVFTECFAVPPQRCIQHVKERFLAVAAKWGTKKLLALCYVLASGSPDGPYRWFSRLGFEREIPDHSTFSKNRHGRFRQSDMFRKVPRRYGKPCDFVGGSYTGPLPSRNAGCETN